MADTIRGVCPQCGKKLEIPAELEEFSCLYCGARMRTEALQARPVEERAVEELLAQLPGCITRYPDLHLRIGKKDFFPTFAQYEQDNTPLLLQLDACCAGYPGGAEALAGHAAAVMLDGLAAHMEKDPRWGRRTRDNVFFDTKVALAIFFTPLLRKLQLELAEPLRTQLQTQWLARWPKQLWRPGDYVQEVPLLLHHDGDVRRRGQARRLRGADGLPRVPRRLAAAEAGRPRAHRGVLCRRTVHRGGRGILRRCSGALCRDPEPLARPVLCGAAARRNAEVL